MLGLGDLGKKEVLPMPSLMVIDRYIMASGVVLCGVLIIADIIILFC